MKVLDIMKRQASVTTPGSHLARAGRLMAEVGCGILPVVDDEEQLVGVITDRDITLAVSGRDRRPSEIQVHQVMSGEAFTCTAEQDVREAMRTMRERRVRRLPVVDSGGRLEGILSLDDIVMEARAFQTEGFTGPFYADIAATLKSINLHPTPAPVA